MSTDSVDSIVSCFCGVGRLLGPSSIRRAYVQHDGHLSLAAAGITLGDTYSILLRLRGGVGDKEAATPQGADTRPAGTSASLQPLPPPPQGRVEGGSSSMPNGFETEDVDDRMRAGSDTAGAQAADHDMSRVVYAQGSIGAHVENPLYWSALPLTRSGSVAPASDLDKTWTAFFKGLNVPDLTASCKARSLHVVAASGTVKKADFVNALQGWMQFHSGVISSFQDAQLLGLEASTNWWCAYDAEQDLQGLRFTMADSVWNGMRRQVAEMLEINDGRRPFAPQHSQPPPAYQNSRHVPQWPQPNSASNSSSDSLSSTQVPRGYNSSIGGPSWQSPEGPPPSWAAPRMNLNPGLPPLMYSSPQQWPGTDVQAAAGGHDTAPETPQGHDVPNGLGRMSRLGDQNVRYLSHQSQDGSRSKGAASNNPHCQAYLALQGTPVMALTLDSAKVGRWHMCKLYWPAPER